jgi:hypothetical protein
MHPNEGTADRIIWLFLGVVALILAFPLLDAGSGAAGGIALAAVGAILALTAATGHCLLYSLFKFSTTK